MSLKLTFFCLFVRLRKPVVHERAIRWNNISNESFFYIRKPHRRSMISVITIGLHVPFIFTYQPLKEHQHEK